MTAVVERVSQGVLSPLGATEKELGVTLVREADRAVELDRTVGSVRERVAELGFGHAQRDLATGLGAVDRRRSMLEQ